MKKSVLNLSEYVAKLPEKNRELFNRIYFLSDDEGMLKIPVEMKPWAEKQFGSVEAVEKQKIIRIDNHILCETSLFNELRAKRPIDSKNDTKILDTIKEKKGDPFCTPLTGTPADTFGRIKGKKSITASNVAKYEALHGLVIFNEHNPLKFSSAEIEAHLDLADKWIKKASRIHPERAYPFIMWNCLWRAAASILHGHMQIVLGKKLHYGEIERLKRFTDIYKDLFNSDYFADVYQVHSSLGLGFKSGNSRIIAHLTPRKEKEVVIFSESLKDVSKPLSKTLKAFLKMGVESFNVGIYLSPLDKSWKIPVITRIVDRGSLESNSADIGSMELFAGAYVVSSDPFQVFERIKKEF